MYRNWLPIVSVCRLWMDVVISSPTLWSTIVIGPEYTYRQVIASRLRYSNTAPIDFYVYVQQPFRLATRSLGRFEWSAMDLRPHIPRIRGFHMPSPHYYTRSEHIYGQLCYPAPLLEHLAVAPVS